MNVEPKTQPYTTNASEIPAMLAQAEHSIHLKDGRFTPIRRHICQLLLEARHPLGAYDIIKQLKGVGSEKPPTVYRALNWLIEHGLVAKIEFNSRYTPIPIGVEADDLAFVICRECGDADTLQAPGVSKSLHEKAKNCGFEDTQMVMEIIGLCGEHKGNRS